MKKLRSLQPMHSPILPEAADDYEKDQEFDALLQLLLRNEFDSVASRKKHIRLMEKKVLMRSVHPSNRQLACFWYHVAELNIQDEHYHAAFEALLLCEKALPHEAQVAQAELHSQLCVLSLRLSFHFQAVRSASLLSRAVQHLTGCEISVSEGETPMLPLTMIGD